MAKQKKSKRKTISRKLTMGIVLFMATVATALSIVIAKGVPIDWFIAIPLGLIIPLWVIGKFNQWLPTMIGANLLYLIIPGVAGISPLAVNFDIPQITQAMLLTAQTAMFASIAISMIMVDYFKIEVNLLKYLK